MSDADSPVTGIVQMPLHDVGDPDCRYYQDGAERVDHCIVCAPVDGDPSLEEHVAANRHLLRREPTQEPPRRWLP